MTGPFIIERTFDASASVIWKAITDKAEMKVWYFNLDEFKPEIGFRFKFTGNGHDGAEYIHHCEITEVIPGKKLTYSWSYEGLEGMSYVSFELYPEGDHKTRLKLTHAGLETFPQNNPDFARTSFEGGWNHIIGKALGAYLNIK